MPEQILFKYKCSVCGEVFEAATKKEAYEKAEECELSHGVVYIPIMRADLQRLLAFIHTKDDKLLTKRLYKTLRKYRSMK